MIKWVEAGQIREKSETRGKSREILVAGSMLDLDMFIIKDGILMFTKATHWSKVGDVCQSHQWWRRFGVYVIKATQEDIKRS